MLEISSTLFLMLPSQSYVNLSLSSRGGTFVLNYYGQSVSHKVSQFCGSLRAQASMSGCHRIWFHLSVQHLKFGWWILTYCGQSVNQHISRYCVFC